MRLAGHAAYTHRRRRLPRSSIIRIDEGHPDRHILPYLDDTDFEPDPDDTDFKIQKGRAIVVTDSHRTVPLPGGRRRLPELRIRSHRTARVVAGVLVPIFLLGLLLWARAAFSMCSGQPGCPPRWMGVTQLAVAVVGLVLGLVVVTSYGRFALADRALPFQRRFAVVYSGLVTLWLLIYLAGRLVIRSQL